MVLNYTVYKYNGSSNAVVMTDMVLFSTLNDTQFFTLNETILG